VLSPLQEAIRIDLALSDNRIALLQGPALALPLVLAAVPLGLLIDRRSRVRLLFILLALGTVGSAVSAVAREFILLFASRSLVGLAAFAVNPVALSLIADLYGQAERGRATTAITLGQLAGMSAAFALGGTLLSMSGLDSGGWRWSMLWLTSPLVLVTLLVAAMREPARTELVVQNPSMRDVWNELRSYRAVIVPLLIGVLALEIAIGAVLVWTAPTLARTYGLAPDRIGAIVATGLAISGVLGPIAGGVLADFCQRAGGPRRTLLALAVLSLFSIPAGIFAVVPWIPAAVALLVLFLTIITAMIVMGTALFTVVIPGELRGLCTAMLAGACVLLGTGIAPLTVSLLSQVMGGPGTIGGALALMCVTSSLLGAAAFAFGRQLFPTRT
jgi:MFS family permease